MTTRLAFAITLMSLFALPVRAQLPELRDFACDATVGQDHYHLLLSRSDTSARMQVTSADTIIADGPAISYRSGTRYFIPTGATTGIKLTLDRDPARICFGAGGTDCHTCAVAPAPARAYVVTYTCAKDDFTLIANVADSSYPDIVVKDDHGKVIASGPGSYWGRHSEHFTLPIGPGENYQVDDAVDFCTTSEPPPPSTPEPPVTSEVRCRAGEGSGQQQFELRHIGDEAFVMYFYGDGGFILAPLSKLEGGGYVVFGGFYGTVTYRPVGDGGGEICDGPTCVTCTAVLD